MDLEANPFMVRIDPVNDKLFAANIASGSVAVVDLKAEKSILGIDEKDTHQFHSPLWVV